MASENAAPTPEPGTLTRHQKDTARFYTKKFGLPDDYESVAALARLVPIDFNADRPEDKAWIYLLAHGRRPTHRAIKTRLWHLKRVAYHRWLEATQRPKMAAYVDGLDLDVLGPQIAAWVQEYLDEHGTGPLWREVGGHWGWDHDHTEAALKALRRAGWITSTAEARSLRPAQPESSDATVPTQQPRRRPGTTEEPELTTRNVSRTANT